jgi:hypothetical protein
VNINAFPDIFEQENKSDQLVEAKESFDCEASDELGNTVTCAGKTLRKAAQVLNLIVENNFIVMI